MKKFLQNISLELVVLIHVGLITAEMMNELPYIAVAHFIFAIYDINRRVNKPA